MNTSSEKRSSKRVSYFCEVECEGAGSRFQTRISDLSADGAFIDAVTSYPEGSTLTLKFAIGSRQITTTAEVRYRMPQIGMGVRFIEMTADDREVIRSVVGTGG